MNVSQPGILAPVPDFARYLEFRAAPDQGLRAAVAALATITIDKDLLVGFGSGLIDGLGQEVNGLRAFPALSGPGCEVPSTQCDLWCQVRGTDRGDIVHAARAFMHRLQPAFRCERIVDAFKFGKGLDLTGYEDGTENPKGETAVDAAIVSGSRPGLDGSSFVAVQQWIHDLDHFETLPQGERDTIIGRRLSDNSELTDAPASAHIKRTEQESFDPQAFVLRRSMPWADANGEGLYFVAFGKTLDPFEVQLRRMTGQGDGIIDGLFRFSRPVSGSYFWCPPVRDGRLDLTALGL